jgi:hypothetical protein
MIERKPLTLNSRTPNTLVREFAASGAFHINYPKNGERQSIFAYARAGRQNSEGFGGGNRIMK